MLRPNGDYSHETLQERRQRRIETRRNAAVTEASGESLSFTPGVHLRQGRQSIVTHQDPHQVSMERADPSPSIHQWWGSQGVVIHHNRQQCGSAAGAYLLSMTGSSEEDPDEEAERNLNNVPGVVIPVVGAVAVAGMQQSMEDTVTVQTNLCSPTINHCHPVHFYGVFDGHGGDHVAIMCRDWMHVILEEELMHLECTILPSASGAASRSRVPTLGQPDVECILKEAWTEVFKKCFSRTEELAMNKCQCGRVVSECSCSQNWLVYSGSAAVVVVLTDEYIVVANCGDSRAILSCSGSVIPLSVDHKPNRPDELARIEASGGYVLMLDGAPRVGGVLAMSRAIGDEYLKPSVTSVPEINFVRRTEEQEFLIIASDGLWDVMSNEMTCHVVKECLRDERSGRNEGRGLLPSRCASAAGLLTNLAIARGSADNITVIVVDLKRTVMA